LIAAAVLATTLGASMPRKNIPGVAARAPDSKQIQDCPKDKAADPVLD
jgi:hypothetical protein